MEISQRQKLLESIGKLKKAHKWFPTDSGVSRGEFFMLHKIVKLNKELQENKPGVKISDLSAAGQMSKPAVSQMLNSLEDRGLVKRVMTKEDRRVVYVDLTESGHMQLKKTMNEFSNLLDKIVAELGEEDTATLVRLFDKLYDIIENMEQYN